MIKIRLRRLVILGLLLLVGLATSGCAAENGNGPVARNVILCIGDGMGPEQIKAGGIYATGKAGSLGFEQFPYQGQMTTAPAGGGVTDSAASATAMATGQKVHNGVISVAIPGDGRELTTLLEIFQNAGRPGGLVTTVPITHATPAAFGAHDPSRGNADAIGRDFLEQTRPWVLMGGRTGLSPRLARGAGYAVVQNRQELMALDTARVKYVSGQFDKKGWVEKNGFPYEYDGLGDLPHLSEMTEVALQILEKNEEGFFLMVEGGKIDWAGHGNDLERNVGETVEFARAVEVVYQWAKGREDTLIVVTADHETGGMKVLKNKGKGQYPEVSWSSGGHTDVLIPVYAQGVGGSQFQGTLDNTEIFTKIMTASGVEVLSP